MKTFAILATLFLTALAAQADEQISPARLESLSCTAANALGASQLTLAGGKVTALTNGLASDYRVQGLGMSADYGFSYVNLANGGDVISLAFPGQTLSSGTQTVTGLLFVAEAANPLQPVIGMGTPWATVTCQLNIAR